MSYKVLLAQDVADTGKKLLKDFGCELVIAEKEEEQEMIRLIKDCDAVFSKTFFLNENILKAGNKLKVIAKHGVGIDNVVDIDVATKLGKYVVNTPLANMESVAEHTVAGILALAKNIITMNQATHNLDFNAPLKTIATDVNGKTVGIIGLGNIGRLVAKKVAMGFNMKVIAYDPFVKDPIEYISMVDDIDIVFKESDFVTLHLGNIKSMKQFVNKSKFDLMKTSACFLNFARGVLVNERDLYEALKNHTIRSAAVDVYSDEPIKADNQLLSLDNIILSPHSAALSQEAMERMSSQGAEGIISILKNEKPKWCCNYKEVKN